MSLAARLLGAHVRGRSRQSAPLAEVLVLEGQPEVGDRGLTRGVDEDVGGLDVAVDQSPGVGVMQGVGDGGDQLRGLPERRSSLPDPGRQVAAFHELGHDEAESVVRAADVEDRHDPGMVEPGQRPGFREKRLDILGTTDAFRPRHLDGDWPVEVVVAGQVDPAEPALTQAPEDAVTVDPRGIAIRRATRTFRGRLGVYRFRQVLRLIHRAIL